jgi:hypothetical protein
MSPPHSHSAAQISQKLGFHQATPYKCIKVWTAVDKFTVVLESVGFNDTEFSVYCRERALLPE